jgi:DNA phosphorothioation-associated putative methyltransferase
MARQAIAMCDNQAWNVVRIEGTRVALLEYEDFDAEHFPALRESTLIDLQTGSTQVRTYRKSNSPPILHRKELLLALSDPRREKFAALTSELQKRNLFVDSHKIGMRNPWRARLRDAGVTLRNHRIVKTKREQVKSGGTKVPNVQVERHRTAIVRNRLSSPMQMLIRHGFLEAYPDVFDYGCGQGDDIRVLTECGISAAGWDPHYRPLEGKRSAELVNLGFVLNVIEDPGERSEALVGAWGLCRKVMAVAVMVVGHYPVDGLTQYRDGFLTARGTFQRFYKAGELRDLVRDTLNVEPVAVAPGIVFVFRDGAMEQEFLFRRRTRHSVPRIVFQPSPRTRLPKPVEPLSERLRPALEQLWKKAVELGRQPDVEELAEIREALASSNVSIDRAMKWCRTIFDEAQFEEGGKRRRDDLLVHFALGAFSGSRAFNSLPSSLRRDVRQFFGSFASAQAEARRFLFSLGSDQVLEQACATAVDARHIHRYDEGRYHFEARQLEDLPAVLRAFVGCAAVLVGDAEDASIVSINVSGRSVTFYFSPNFGARLTILDRVSTVFLRNQEINDRKFTEDQRLVFLQRSVYELDERQRRVRAGVEARILSLLAGTSAGRITVRYGDVVAAMRNTK